MRCSLTQSLPQFPECPALFDCAGQWMANDLFSEPAAFDQCLQIDAGVDAHFLAHEDEIFRADIAGRAFLTGKRTATQTAHCRVKNDRPPCAAQYGR